MSKQKIQIPTKFKEVGPLKMKKYQKEAFFFGIRLKQCGILLDMGLGKTLVAINIMRYHIQFNKANKILIVCPSSIIYNWENAIHESSEYSCLVLSDIRENRKHKFENTNCEFNIINYESLYPTLRDLNILKKEKNKRRDGKIITRMTYNKKYRKMVEKLGYDCIIFDESSKYLKTHDSDRTRACVVLADSAKYKLLLTGTLIGNKPLELYPQFRVMTEGRTLGTSFYKFRNKFFEKSGYKYVLQKQYVPFLRKIVYANCIRKTRKECLPELPGIIHNKILIEYNKNERKEYENLRRIVVSEIDTELGKAKVNITNIFTQLIRLQQFSSGFVYDERKDMYVRLRTTPKLNTLAEQLNIILDNEETAVIWCRFHFSIGMIEKLLTKQHIPFLSMSGKDNAKEKYKKWKKFQTSNIPIFVGQVESGGFGIELFKEETVKQQHMISYEYTWSLDTRDQAQSRIYRLGQTSVCIHTDLIIKNTIDEKILKVVEQNKKISDLIMSEGTKAI
jgi:SNF2 family DNA or RNA helicase